MSSVNSSSSLNSSIFGCEPQILPEHIKLAYERWVQVAEESMIKENPNTPIAFTKQLARVIFSHPMITDLFTRTFKLGSVDAALVLVKELPKTIESVIKEDGIKSQIDKMAANYK
jgi:hypothetical protein